MVKREMYLQRIRPFYESEMVKVIMGIRRCGKSTLLRQIREELQESGVPESRMIDVNFEDYRYHSLKNPDAFYQYIESKLVTNQKYYLFFDEIQNVTDFELVVNSFRATHDVSIFLTGSNSKLLSGELASHLGGRTVSFYMMPFRFQEYLTFRGESEGNKKLFAEYIKWGGFPMVCRETEHETKWVLLSSLYDSVILKDIIMRNKVASPHALERILEYVIANTSATLSGNNIANCLKEEGIDISAPTVYDYLRYMEESCIVRRASRYDIRGKKVLSFEEKFYVCDMGLFALKKNRVKDEYNLVIETIVYNELIARGYQVYIGKTYKGEVDFIAERGGEKFYIQAAYLMENEATIEREFGAYEAIRDNYPKYVISYDDWTADREGIRHLNLIDFLTDETVLR